MNVPGPLAFVPLFPHAHVQAVLLRHLRRNPGGREVGYLMDKFGINWVVSIDKA